MTAITEEELRRAPFYFCDLKSGDVDCARKNECKRYMMIKDLDYKDYSKYTFARLYNICNKQNYKMFLKILPGDPGYDETSNNDSTKQTD